MFYPLNDLCLHSLYLFQWIVGCSPSGSLFPFVSMNFPPSLTKFGAEKWVPFHFLNKPFLNYQMILVTSKSQVWQICHKKQLLSYAMPPWTIGTVANPRQHQSLQFLPKQVCLASLPLSVFGLFSSKISQSHCYKLRKLMVWKESIVFCDLKSLKSGGIFGDLRILWT